MWIDEINLSFKIKIRQKNSQKIVTLKSQLYSISIIEKFLYASLDAKTLKKSS